MTVNEVDVSTVVSVNKVVVIVTGTMGYSNHPVRVVDVADGNQEGDSSMPEVDVQVVKVNSDPQVRVSGIYPVFNFVTQIVWFSNLSLQRTSRIRTGDAIVLAVTAVGNRQLTGLI